MHGSTTVLTRHLLSSKASAEKRKNHWIILPLHYMYILLLVGGLIEILSLGGDDGDETEADENVDKDSGIALPLSFMIVYALMLLSSILLLYLKSKNFLLDDTADQSKISNSKITANASGKEALNAGEVDVSADQVDSIVKFRADRLVYFSAWCFFANLIFFFIILLLTTFSQNVRYNNDGEWMFVSCDAALITDTICRFAILNTAILTRLVFVKTEAQSKPQSWQQSLSQLASDYKRALLTCTPETFSDAEEEVEEDGNRGKTVGNEKNTDSVRQQTSSQLLSDLGPIAVRAAHAAQRASRGNANTQLQQKKKEQRQKIYQDTQETQPDDDDMELRNLPTLERCDTEEGLMSARSGQQLSARTDNSGKSSSRKLFNANEQKLQQKPLSVIVEEEKFIESSEKSRQKSSQEAVKDSPPDKDAPELASQSAHSAKQNVAASGQGILVDELEAKELDQQSARIMLELPNNSKQSGYYNITGSQQDMIKKVNSSRKLGQSKPGEDFVSEPRSNERSSDIKLRFNNNNASMSDESWLEESKSQKGRQNTDLEKKLSKHKPVTQQQTAVFQEIISNESEDVMHGPDFQDDDYPLRGTPHPAVSVRAENGSTPHQHSEKQVATPPHLNRQRVKRQLTEDPEQKTQIVTQKMNKKSESQRQIKLMRAATFGDDQHYDKQAPSSLLVSSLSIPPTIKDQAGGSPSWVDDDKLTALNKLEQTPQQADFFFAHQQSTPDMQQRKITAPFFGGIEPNSNRKMTSTFGELPLTGLAESLMMQGIEQIQPPRIKVKLDSNILSGLPPEEERKIGGKSHSDDAFDNSDWMDSSPSNVHDAQDDDINGGSIDHIAVENSMAAHSNPLLNQSSGKNANHKVALQPYMHKYDSEKQIDQGRIMPQHQSLINIPDDGYASNRLQKENSHQQQSNISKNPSRKIPRDKNEKKLGGKYSVWESESQRVENERTRTKNQYGNRIVEMYLVSEVIKTIEVQTDQRQLQNKPIYNGNNLTIPVRQDNAAPLSHLHSSQGLSKQYSFEREKNAPKVVTMGLEEEEPFRLNIDMQDCRSSKRSRRNNSDVADSKNHFQNYTGVPAATGPGTEANDDEKHEVVAVMEASQTDRERDNFFDQKSIIMSDAQDLSHLGNYNLPEVAKQNYARTFISDMNNNGGGTTGRRTERHAYKQSPNSFIEGMEHSFLSQMRATTFEQESERVGRQHQDMAGPARHKFVAELEQVKTQNAGRQDFRRFWPVSTSNGRNRIVKSDLQTNVAAIEIVPTGQLTEYQLAVQKKKLQNRLASIKEQNDDYASPEKGHSAKTRLQNESAASFVSPLTKLHQLPKPHMTTGRTINGGYTPPQPLPQSLASVVKSERPQNRFVKNILKKGRTLNAGGADKLNIKKKQVSFNLDRVPSSNFGTGTRGKGNADEFTSYGQDQDYENNSSFTGRTGSVSYRSHMTPRELEQLSMAMPGQDTRHIELQRRIQEGPARVDSNALQKNQLAAHKKQQLYELHKQSEQDQQQIHTRKPSFNDHRMPIQMPMRHERQKSLSQGGKHFAEQQRIPQKRPTVVASPMTALEMTLSQVDKINPYLVASSNKADTPNKTANSDSQLGTVSPSDIIVQTSMDDKEVKNPYDEFYGNLDQSQGDDNTVLVIKR